MNVPAGTYDTVRIDCKGFWTRVFGGTGVGKVVETVWYAPQLRRQIRQDFITYTSTGQLDTRQRTELVEVTRQPR